MLSDKDNDNDLQNGNGSLNEQQEVAPIELECKQELSFSVQEM